MPPLGFVYPQRGKTEDVTAMRHALMNGDSPPSQGVARPDGQIHNRRCESAVAAAGIVKQSEEYLPSAGRSGSNNLTEQTQSRLSFRRIRPASGARSFVPMNRDSG